MIKIEESLTNSLARFNFMLRNEDITVECINNYNGFSLLGENYGPFEKGKRYKLKLFIAIIFIQNDVLRIAPSSKCDNIDVQRYAISERDDTKLIITNDNFFLNRIKEFKDFLEIEINKNYKPKIDLDRYNSYASNIIDSRLLKLLKLAKAEISLDDEKRLTIPEKLFYKILNKNISKWRAFFLTA